jgi:hypothetical protein
MKEEYKGTQGYSDFDFPEDQERVEAFRKYLEK